MTKGRWIVGAAVVAVAIVVVVAMRRHDDEPTPSAPADAVSPTSHETRDVAKPKTPRASRVVSADASAQQTTATSDTNEFPTLDVEVVHADGTPAQHALVYVLAPGADGRDDIGRDACPSSTTGDDGRCRVMLPRSGAYDLGAVVGAESAVVPDIIAPRGPLRIVLPKFEEVLLVATPDIAARLRSGVSCATIRPPDSGTLHAFPGRGERSVWAVSPTFAAGVLVSRMRAPADVEWIVDVSPDLRATPTSLRAPARVELGETGLLQKTVRARFAPADGSPPPSGIVRIELGVTPAIEHFSSAIGARMDSDDHRGPRRETSIWLPPSGGTLRWHGSGVEPGERAVSAADVAASAPLDVVVQLDGSALPADPSRAAQIDIRVRGVRTNTDSAQCILLSAAGGRTNTGVQPDGSAHLKSELPGWIGAAQNDWAAGPVRVTDAASTPRELALAPGGFLVVECDTMPPAQLGGLTIARKDGVPLYFLGCDLLPSIDAITGNKIGPLPPGEHTFVLRLAGFDVGEVTATVVAGETTKLVVPHVPPR